MFNVPNYKLIGVIFYIDEKMGSFASVKTENELSHAPIKTDVIGWHVWSIDDEIN